MDGIQILNETIKWTANAGDLCLGVVFLIFAIGLLILTIFAFKEYEIVTGLFLLFFTIILGVGGVLGIYEFSTKTTYPEYQVLINDSVKMNEFNQKYEIIKQDGKIYTIIEKVESK